jgi:hypothetical protein
MEGTVVLVVIVLVALTLLTFVSRLPGPDFGHFLREGRWKSEERTWERGGGPPEIVRTYRGKGEMERDRGRLAALGYRVQDELWQIDQRSDGEPMPSRDSMVFNRLRAQSRGPARGPAIVVTYVRET